MKDGMTGWRRSWVELRRIVAAEVIFLGLRMLPKDAVALPLLRAWLDYTTAMAKRPARHRPTS